MPAPKARRVLRMSERHVEAVTRKLPDPGSQVFVGRRAATDADYKALTSELVASAPPGDFWVFAYGSLIWNPAFDYTESRLADARGWRRTFCLGWDYRFRGNREQPGLMLALDRGGRCRGVVYRLPADALRSQSRTIGAPGNEHGADRFSSALDQGDDMRKVR